MSEDVPALQSGESDPAWNLVFQSVAGTSHERSGIPCQDVCLGRIVETVAGRLLIAACADGAGSAEYSDIGAALACRTFVNQAEAVVTRGDFNDSVVDRSTLLGWYRAARESIEAHAAERGLGVRELACTFLTALLGQDWAVFGQIGDGAIVRDLGEDCEIIFWPQAGEYVNEAYFLTDRNYEDRLQFRRIEERIDALAILTDGLQMLALDYAAKRAHTPFFRPIFSALSRADDLSRHWDALHDFLTSSRVNDRTDDDKTLLLAVRRLRASHEPENPPAEPG